MKMFFASVCWLLVAPNQSIMTYQSGSPEWPSYVMIVADRDGNELRSCSFSVGENERITQDTLDFENGYLMYRMNIQSDVDEKKLSR